MCETAHTEASLKDMAKYSKEQIDEAFSLESLKHQQREAIREFVSGRDVLPTGFGKSYCFALLPTALDHLRAGKRPSIMVTPAALPFSLTLARLSEEMSLQNAMIDRSFVAYGAVARSRTAWVYV